MRTLEQLRIRVPEDMLITGFNDVSAAWLSSPSITTIRQPTEAIGRMALRRLLERMASPDLPPEEMLIEAPLVVRESTGKRCGLAGANGVAKQNSHKRKGNKHKG